MGKEDASYGSGRVREWIRQRPTRGLAVGSVVAFGLLMGTVFAASSGVSDLPDISVVRSPRVVVLKSSRTLCLFDGDTLVRSYSIALGSEPVGQKVREGDGRTPEGRFRVCSMKDDSKYHRFLGLNYPNRDAARRGYRSGLISEGAYQNLMDAAAAGRCPNWSTALGGGIGIHGNGIESDWTAGCIAMSDKDVEELFNVMRLGDPVQILP